MCPFGHEVVLLKILYQSKEGVQCQTFMTKYEKGMSYIIIFKRHKECDINHSGHFLGKPNCFLAFPMYWLLNRFCQRILEMVDILMGLVMCIFFYLLFVSLSASLSAL